MEEDKAVQNSGVTKLLISSNDIHVTKSFTSSNDIHITKSLTSSNDIIEEIQKKTELISEQTKGTQFEELADELNQSSKFLSQTRDPVGFEKQVSVMQNTLRAICSKFPEGQKGEACELLEMMSAEPLIEDKMPLLNNILSKVSYQLDMAAHLSRFEGKLDSIRFDIFKIKLNNSNVISNLDVMKEQLKKLSEVEALNTLFLEKLDSTQAEKLNDLNIYILERLAEIETLAKDLSNMEDTQKIINLLTELKQSDSDILLQRSSGIATLISFFVTFGQLYQQYGPA